MTTEKKKELALKVLSVVAAVGFVSVAVIAPGIVALAPLFTGKRYASRRNLAEAAQYGLRHRWLEVESSHRSHRLILTNTGRKRFTITQFDQNTIKAPKRWDRRWRVVIFDIPNRYKFAREVLRETLRRMGFRQLQESVWIHPFPCETVIDELATLYGVRPFVQTLLVFHFDRENEYLEKFNLEK